MWSDHPELSTTRFAFLLCYRTAALVVSTIMLSTLSRRFPAPTWPFLAVVVLSTSWWLASGLRHKVSGGSRQVVILFGAAVVVVGVLMIIVWSRGPAPSYLLVAGASLALIGVGSELTVARRTVRHRPSVAVGFAIASVGLTAGAWRLETRTGTVWPIVVLVAAVASAYLALLLGAEPWIGRSTLLKGRRDLAAGTLFAVGGIVWLLARHGAWNIVPIVLVIVVLTAVTSTDFDGELLVGLLVVAALFWATFPRGAKAQDFLPRLAGASDNVVTVGDSYVSGEGARKFEDHTNVVGSNVCRRSPTAWPLTFADKNTTLSISLACSGAVIDNITGDPQYKGEPTAWPGLPNGANQIDRLTEILRTNPTAVSRVIVGIGGNDLGFSDIGVACVGAGNCDEIGDVWRARLPELQSNLVAVYRKVLDTVRTSMSPATVYVVGYPVSLSDHGCWWAWLSESEHRFLSDLIVKLNDTIETAATDAGVKYISTVAGALEHAHLRLCDSRSHSGINLLVLNPMQGSLLASLDPRHWVNNNFHPNEFGHQAIGNAVKDWFKQPTTAMARPPVAVVSPCRAGSCKAYVASWSRRHLLSFATGVAPPIALLFAGAWLFVTHLQLMMRKRGTALTRSLAARLQRLHQTKPAN